METGVIIGEIPPGAPPGKERNKITRLAISALPILSRTAGIHLLVTTGGAAWVLNSHNDIFDSNIQSQ